MIGFLLPSFSGQGGRTPQEIVEGYVINEDGEEVKITALQVQWQDNRLRALRELGLDFLSQTDGQQPPYLCRMLGTVGLYPVLTSGVLFFGETQYSQWMRQFLYSQTLSWAQGPEEIDRLRQYIDEVVGTGLKEASLYFMLLTAEAHRNGIYATDDQINMVIRAHGQLVQAGRARPIAQIRKNYGLTENDLKRAIGDFVAIVRYGHLATNRMALSEPELRQQVREEAGVDSVAGTFVSFYTGTFTDRVKEPTEEQLQDHFKAFQKMKPGKVDKESNPFGFGYMLPDRVQVEYLKVDLAETAKVAEAKYQSLSVTDQEETLQSYWRTRQARFRQPLSADPCNPDAPRYRDPPFDEVFNGVKEAWLGEQSRQKAEKLLALARQQARAQVAEAKRRNPEAPSVADYAVIADALGSEQVKVSYGKTEYFSLQTPSPELQVEQTYKMRSEVPQQGLIEILFECKPLRKREISRLDMPPVDLYEDIPSLIAMDYTDRPSVAYLMRIVGVDAEREAQGLSDDGRQGSASNAPPAESKLRERVKREWQTQQAFALARQEAQAFAEQAKSDWAKAVKELNDSKKDPCQPNAPDFLRERTLAEERQSIEFMNQTAQRNPEYANRFRPQLARKRAMIQESVKRAYEQGRISNATEKPTETGPLVLELADQLQCLVFKDLQVTVPSIDEYHRQKPITANVLMQRIQPLLSLIHFNPRNIEKRSRYTSAFQAEEASEEAPEKDG